MKTIFTTVLLCFVCLFLWRGNLNAQVTSADFRNLDSTSVIKVTLSGGSVYEGKFVRQTSVRIVINVSGSGDMSFLFSDIKSLDINGLSSKRPAVVDIPAVDSVQMVLVSLLDGSVLAGSLVSKSDSEVVLETVATGRLSIPANQIKSVASKEPKGPGNPRGWLPNPNPGRYFFAPSGFNLKKGEGYYQNVYVDISMFGYGVTDWFSIGGGIELVATLASLTQGQFTPLWVLTPKVGFPIGKNLHLGAGFMGGAIGGMGFNTGFFGWGITYGVLTYGDVDNNFTIGAGLPMTTVEMNNGKHLGSPIIVVDVMYRVSQKVSLISENWIFTGKGLAGTDGFGSLLGYGIRLWGESMSFDIGFINNKDIASILIIGIPYVDFVYRFNKRKK